MTTNNVLRAWPAERLAELVGLVATMSIGAAAREMGVTKNMAIGALSRAAERGEYEPPERPSKWPPERIAELKQMAATTSLAEAASKMNINKSTASTALSRARRQTEKSRWEPPEPKGCRWICGDPGKPGWSWCDAPIVRLGSSWCGEHHKRVWLTRVWPRP